MLLFSALGFLFLYCHHLGMASPPDCPVFPCSDSSALKDSPKRMPCAFPGDPKTNAWLPLCPGGTAPARPAGRAPAVAFPALPPPRTAPSSFLSGGALPTRKKRRSTPECPAYFNSAFFFSISFHFTLFYHTTIITLLRAWCQEPQLSSASSCAAPLKLPRCWALGGCFREEARWGQADLKAQGEACSWCSGDRGVHSCASQERSSCPGATRWPPGCVPCCTVLGVTSWLTCSSGSP